VKRLAYGLVLLVLLLRIMAVFFQLFFEIFFFFSSGPSRSKKRMTSRTTSVFQDKRKKNAPRKQNKKKKDQEANECLIGVLLLFLCGLLFWAAWGLDKRSLCTTSSMTDQLCQLDLVFQDQRCKSLLDSWHSSPLSTTNDPTAVPRQVFWLRKRLMRARHAAVRKFMEEGMDSIRECLRMLDGRVMVLERDFDLRFDDVWWSRDWWNATMLPLLQPALKLSPRQRLNYLLQDVRDAVQIWNATSLRYQLWTPTTVTMTCHAHDIVRLHGHLFTPVDLVIPACVARFEEVCDTHDSRSNILGVRKTQVETAGNLHWLWDQ